VTGLISARRLDTDDEKTEVRRRASRAPQGAFSDCQLLAPGGGIVKMFGLLRGGTRQLAPEFGPQPALGAFSRRRCRPVPDALRRARRSRTISGGAS
jgi:hypothetical protein